MPMTDPKDDEDETEPSLASQTRLLFVVINPDLFVAPEEDALWNDW
ncbi:hypothetical protein BH11ARM2_BH11ARM2_26900 [soil metagenome]